MAYTNRVPEISRIAQSVRDKDFISISEVKAFDEKLNEIIEKFASVNNSELGSQANNIGDLIRQVEYNMADAIIFSETGTIDGYKTAEINGVVVPNPGENSYDKLVDRLNTLYNDFIALYGNDESIANWKYDLDAKKEALIKVFKDKINGIFGRVAEQNAIESKESGNNDYITSDAVKINANEIMRLNPDKHAFTRQIIVTPQGPNIDTIAFEVGELEENSLVLNMKIQNTDLYYNYNIVIDNNKVNILKEEHIKLSKSYGITIKIYKYKASSGKKMYVFVLNSSNVNNSVPYCFELSGLLINGYDFGSSGQIPTDHGSYYAYEEVDKTQKPDYNKTYYVKSVDEGGTGVDTNYIIYSVTQDNEPVYSKIYYTKVTTDDGTIKYKINRYLTSFDAETTYYEKNTDSETTKDKESDYVFNEFTHLRTFDDSKTYYEKVNEWELIKSFDINSTEYTEGTVDSLNKNIDDEKVFENNDQVVIDGVKYSNAIRYKNIDIDAGELFGNSVDSEKAIKSSKLYNYDDGVRFYKPFPGMISKIRRGAKKINGNLDVSLGSKVAEMTVIQPQGSLFGLSVVSENNVVPVTEEQLRYTYKLILDTNEIYGYDVHENLVNFFEILKDAETDKSIDSFGQTLYDHVMFVDSFRIKLIGAIGSILDFMIVADGLEEYSKCSHIYYNTKDEEVIFPVFKSTHRDDDSNVISLKKANWVSEYTDKNNCTALNSYGEVFTTEDGKVWTKNNTGSSLMLDQFEYFNNKYIGIKYETDESGAEIAKFYVSNDSFYTIEAESSCNVNENYNIKYKQNVVIGDAKHRYGRYFPIVLKDGGVAVYDIQSNTVTRPGTNGLYFVYPKNGRTFKLKLSTDNVGVSKATLYSVSNDIDSNFTNMMAQVRSVKLLPTKIDDVNAQMPIIHKIIAHGEIVEVFYSVCNDDLTKLYTNVMYIYDTIENNVFSMNMQINEADAIINDITSVDDIICDITDATVYSSEINVNRYARDGAIYILPTKDSGLYYKKWVYEEPEENKYYETTSQVCGWMREHNLTNPFVSISKFGKNIVKVVPFINGYEGSNKSYIYFFAEKLTSYASTKTIDTYTDIDTIKPFDFYLEDESGNKILSTEWMDREVSGYICYWLFGSNDKSNYKLIIFGTNCIYYKDGNDESVFTKSVRGINNSILAINDIVERGNNLLIGESLNGSLQYDKLSGTFSKNVVDNDEYYKYASTSVGVFAYGQGNTYLVDWLHGRTKTFDDISIDNILECGTDNTIYLFPSNANGLYKYNKENQVITKENVFESLENIKCEYGFETTDGLFIIGTDKYNRNVIYFSKNEFAEDTFIQGGHSDTESQRTFVKLLDCEKIDYCRPLDNEIIISTYDSNEPDVKYYFERNKYSDKYLTFVKQQVSDTNHIYSFNSIETYMGQIFVLNGTGSNPNVKRGFGILSRNFYESGSILEDNKFYDIDIITEIGIDNKIEVMNSPSLFVHGNLLFGVFINRNITEDKSKIVAYYYDPTLKTPTFVKIDNTSSPLIESILNVANKELSDIEDIEMNGIQFVAIQESNDKTENVIKDYNFKDIIDDYQIDKFYFDKENKGVSFGSYINANNYFRIENNCMAFGTTVNTHNTNIAISLPEDMAIAVFDKTLPMLKTVKLRYRELVSSSYHYVSIDSRMNIKAIFMGSGSTDNYLYLLITGNFPLLTQSGTVVTETQTSASTNRLFKIAISDIVNSQNTVSTIEFITEIGTNDEDSLINYVKKQIYDTDNLILNEGLDYDVRNKRQFIGTARNILYNNVDSLVFWNTNSASIDVITPIVWNDDIPDINLSNNNAESETYKDYKIFISNSKSETKINHFYSYDGDKNTKKEITVNIDENLGTDAEKPGLYAVKTYNEDGTVKDTKYEKPDTFFRIGKQIFVKNGRLPLVTDIEVNPNKTDELVSFKVSKNSNFDLRDDIDVNYLKPIYDGALVRTKDKTKSYKISKDGKMFSIDTSDTGSNNDILQTRLGLFRYANDNLYFNPKGVSSTIKIKSNDNWPVNFVYESINGIFISLCKQAGANDQIGYLYRMKNVPLDNTHIIYLNDKKYFDEINCNGMSVKELQDTQFGTFAIVGDDSDNTNPSRILKWNGEDFYVINEYNVAVLNLFDTSEGLFARIYEKDYIYKYNESKDTFEQNIEEKSNKECLLDPAFYYNFEHPTYKYYETDYGPVSGIGDKIYNFKTKQYVDGLSGYLFNERYVTIRKYFINNNYKSRNLYKLANYFVNKYNLPLDTNLKVFGSILYNGLQVPVSGMKILSNPGNSTEPFTVSFSIDKDARFTRNIDTINAFFAKKSNNGYLEDINIGVITDYDTESAKYYDHVYNITKINLVVLSDYNPDKREEEFKAQYEELMSDINDLKTELKQLILDKKANVESSDTLLATLERNSDAYTSHTDNGRNIAETYGYTVDANGAISKSEMRELFSKLKQSIKDNDFTKVFIGDYLVLPKLAYSHSAQYENYDNVRFDVMGINTYATSSSNRGILFQSHGILLPEERTTNRRSHYHHAIACNHNMAEYIEKNYGLLTAPRRNLGNTFYNVNDDYHYLNGIYGLYSNASESENKSVNYNVTTTKVFFPAEQEIGHPQQTNCRDNNHNLCVWPLYNKAPQTRIKNLLYPEKWNATNKKWGYWTDSFSATGTPTNGKEIKYGQVVYVSKEGLFLRQNVYNETEINTQTTTDATKYIVAQYDKRDNLIGCAPCFYLGTATETVKTRFIEEYNINPTNKTYNYKYYTINPDGSKEYETTEYSGTYSVLQNVADAMYYVMKYTFKDSSGKVIDTRNAMDLRALFGFTVDSNGLKQLATLLKNDSKARSMCMIGDYITLNTYEWEAIFGAKFNVNKPKYVLAEVDNGHLIFISSDTHSVSGNKELTWNQLIAENKKQNLMLPILQSQLGITPTSYTRNSNISYMKNEYVFFPTEYNVFGAYTYEATADRYSGEKQWELFKNKRFRRALNADRGILEGLYDDWWLATKTTNDNYPSSPVTNPEYSDFGAALYPEFTLNAYGSRPSFMI